MSRRAISLFVLILLVHIGLLFSGIFQNFVTMDESALVPSGLAHWRTGSFTPYRVNPPLPRLLSALPLLAVGPEWEPELPRDSPGSRPEWALGKSFAKEAGEQYIACFRWARWAGVFWSLAGACLLYRWGKKLYGEWAGFLAMALWCLDPKILAHAGLATTDIPATVMGLAACYGFWRYLCAPTWSSAFLVGILLGLAQLTKHVWLVLYVVWPVLAVMYWWRWGAVTTGDAPRPSLARRACVARIGHALCILLVSVLVINLGYGFENTGRSLGEFQFVSKLFAGENRLGNRFQGTWLENVVLPLPANYLAGIDVQRRDFESGWPFYLGGEWRNQGWWYFYLYALGVKLPLGTLALIAGGIALFVVRAGATRFRDELCFLLPGLVILTLISSQTGLQYLRYALPAFPMLFLCASRCGAVAQRSRIVAAIVMFLVGWVAWSSLSVRPHYLSYFNEWAGGPDRGTEHLVDSNIDWGQDLLFLKDWLDQRQAPQGEERFGLAYFNLVDPRIVGIEYRLPPLLPPDWRDGEQLDPGEIGPQPGLYAVSVHFVRGGSFAVPDGTGKSMTIPPESLSYFQQFQPIARAGHTLWIYRLGGEEVNRVRRQLNVPELVD
ncbi:MAG: glycosyltransferase family 39 protein [Gemmataceae bacterium]|nr:glycosyltransferase family 39 protein [Gemmataceae bacterium]MCI0739811.1 glycosyltransferase family 39 protein [Gemmataceae bacterium]